MRVRALPRLFLATTLVVAPVACASAPQRAGGEAARPMPREQVMNRDRALVAGLATSLALGLLGLGTLLANANFVTPRVPGGPHEMPTPIAVAGGVMSLGFLAAVPLGLAVERHRQRHPDYFNRRAPRATASLRPTPLRPGPLYPAPLHPAPLHP